MVVEPEHDLGETLIVGPRGHHHAYRLSGRPFGRTALELGITGLDTAYNYNKFSSRLRNAVGRSSDDLGRIPDVVLIHNPEQDPAALPGAAETMCQLQAHGMIKDS